MSIQINFEIGHEASIRTKKTPEGFTHDWEVFVRGCNGVQLHYFVERVVFLLHETFPNPKRVVKQPPYVVKESGYAGFILPIEIHLKHTNEPKKIRFNYDLNLQTSGPAICKVTKEKYVFKNPNDEFRSCLLKGGGTAVSSNSFHEINDIRLSSDSKNELVNKPKLSGSDGMKQKHRNRMDDQRSSNSFQDLFGTPITKTNKVFSDPKSVPKDNVKSNSSINNKSDKEKEKSKDKTKFSPNKDREKDRDREKGKEKMAESSERKKERDEKKSKDKEGRKEREHTKEKPSKREKSPKPRSPSPKRPPSPPPKRSTSPPKYKEEKSSSKDRERKEKEFEKKPKKEKRDKEHKERKSREKDVAKIEGGHKEHKSKEKSSGRDSAIKEQPETQKLEKVKERAKDLIEKDNDKVETPERFEKKAGEERKEKHKHKKKDKEKKDKEKKDKERKDKDKAVVMKIDTTKEAKEEKESLFSSPKGDDRKKMSLFSEQDLSNSSLSSAEEEPLFEPTIKKLKSEEKPKKEKSKKSKDRKAEKEEKKRKRKAERSSESPPRASKVAKDDSATKASQEPASDSEQPATNLSVQTPNDDVDKENHDGQEDYMEVLRGLQLKIMNLQDNSELQKVVQMIAQTGQYEVSQRTFDFDLCLLDKGTVRQLQDFFENIS